MSTNSKPLPQPLSYLPFRLWESCDLNMIIKKKKNKIKNNTKVEKVLTAQNGGTTSLHSLEGRDQLWKTSKARSQFKYIVANQPNVSKFFRGLVNFGVLQKTLTESFVSLK